MLDQHNREKLQEKCRELGIQYFGVVESMVALMEKTGTMGMFHQQSNDIEDFLVKLDNAIKVLKEANMLGGQKKKVRILVKRKRKVNVR